MHEHRPVVLHHDQPGGHRQVGRQPARVVDLAASDDQSQCHTPARTDGQRGADAATEGTAAIYLRPSKEDARG